MSAEILLMANLIRVGVIMMILVALAGFWLGNKATYADKYIGWLLFIAGAVLCVLCTFGMVALKTGL